MSAPLRYRFGDYVLSPRQRLLWRRGVPVPLIPKYFDLLHLLVVRRREAVSKADIFAVVWSDVIVTDGALAQAVRTVRRALGDDPKTPRFIRTVSRHGYQFVASDLSEEADGDAPGPIAVAVATPAPLAGGSPDVVVGAVDRLMEASRAGASAEAEARQAAGDLVGLDAGAAVAQLRARPGHARALAYLRDARWDAPTRVEVPLAGDPELARTALEIVRMRLRDGAALVRTRTRGAAGVGALVGAFAGAIGGGALMLAPESSATPLSVLALAILGGGAGAAGTAAVVLGVAGAELVARSWRGPAVVVAALLSGGLAGAAANLAVRALVQGLLRLGPLAIAGPADGAVLAAAVALGYLLTTGSARGGMLPAPRGWSRAAVLVATALFAAAAGAALGNLDRPLVGGLVNQIAKQSGDAPLALGPLAGLIGEATFGPLTRVLLAAFEGAAFGLAVGVSLTRRRAPDVLNGQKSFA